MIYLILVGFAMITLGVALLMLGEVPFFGKRISAWRSRSIGAILVLFLPMALAVRLACNLVFDRDAIEGPVVTWVLCGVCWFVVFAILFRVVVPKKDARPTMKLAAKPAISAKNPFGEVVEETTEVQEPTVKSKPPPISKPAVSKKVARKPVQEENPFDFS